MRRRFACITILTTLAAALDRLVDIANDHWVEVTGEGSVNAAPDFPRAFAADAAAPRRQSKRARTS